MALQESAVKAALQPEILTELMAAFGNKYSQGDQALNNLATALSNAISKVIVAQLKDTAVITGICPAGLDAGPLTLGKIT